MLERLLVETMSWYQKLDYDGKYRVHIPHMQLSCDTLGRIQAKI